jgi:hypothetical protein
MSLDVRHKRQRLNSIAKEKEKKKEEEEEKIYMCF